MNNKIVIGTIIVIIIGGALFLIGKNDKLSKISPIIGNNNNVTLKDVITTSGKGVFCHVFYGNTSTESSYSDLHIDSKMNRIIIRAGADKSSLRTNVIFKDLEWYSWDSIKAEGAFATNQDFSAQIIYYLNNKVSQFDECIPWNVEETIFQVPANIHLVDVLGSSDPRGVPGLGELLE